MKFAICNEIFGNWKLEDAFAFAKKSGYDAIEIAPFTIAENVNSISSAERQRIRNLATSTGLEIAGIHWVLVKPEGLSYQSPRLGIAGPHRAIFCRSHRLLRGIWVGRSWWLARQNSVMSCLKYLWSGPADWAADTFRPAVARAEKRGVTICFEPLAPAETNFINTASAAIEFVQRIPSPAFQIILDVKAMCAETKGYS